MTLHFWLPIFGLLLAVASAEAARDVPTDLTAKAVRCKKPTVPRPSLPAEKGREGREAVASGWYSAVVADFNGDGWCDFAWAIPFPVNSKMESYFLNEMLVLGGPQGWRQPFKGNRPARFELDPDVWPRFRVDLTDVALLHRKTGGAPFLLGLMDGTELGKTWSLSGCGQYSSVHRWDDTVDGFKRVTGAQRDAVLSYYYTHVEKPCR